jgi:SAM-dependent methyltransferase
MSFYAETYGPAWAPVYDEWRDTPELAAMVQALAELAGPGPALELGVGTGRVALPLAATGLAVHGIDVSAEMLAELAKKDPQERVMATSAAMADFSLPHRYSLIYVVQHTLYCLDTQAAQIECLRRIETHLGPDGTVVIEGSVLHTDHWQNNQMVRVVDMDDGGLVLRVGRFDPVTQCAQTHHVAISNGSITVRPLRLRYCTPAELDAMAMIAGLHLVERWSTWEAEPFSATSRKHISIYRRKG